MTQYLEEGTRKSLQALIMARNDRGRVAPYRHYTIHRIYARYSPIKPAYCLPSM